MYRNWTPGKVAYSEGESTMKDGFYRFTLRFNLGAKQFIVKRVIHAATYEEAKKKLDSETMISFDIMDCEELKPETMVV